jgi:D-alanyl-D-alanine carboxypeptidase/D-alanyl-D-alanine-endopeptidase (penicillin-binding protein 4)
VTTDSDRSARRKRIRAAFTAIIAVVGVATVVTLVVLPVLAVQDAQRDMRAVDVDVVTGSLRQLAEPGDLGEGPRDLFSVRRTPDVLVTPVLDRRAFEAVASIDTEYPEPSCLSIRIDGVEVLQRGTTNALIPASVQKLLTAHAVLATIEPGETLATTVWTTAQPVDGVLDGNLILVGGGDPMLAQQVYVDAYTRQPQLLTPISVLAQQIADAGVTRVRGRILVDDSRYDRERVVGSWPDRYRTQFNAGPIGALTVNDGFAEWDPARVYADDPAVYAGEVLDRELNRIGIRVDGATRRGDVPDDATLLTEIHSPPIEILVQQMLRESDNNTAESLLKELGFRNDGVGTTAGGARVVLETAQSSGFDVGGLAITDGSGLDRGNLVTCSALSQLLERAGPTSIIGSGLAVAAESGTISHRFADTIAAGKLHAKTGLLNNVNGLAGWVEGADGTIITFAQLLNGIPLNSRIGFELQEALAVELAAVAFQLDVEDVSLPAQ